MNDIKLVDRKLLVFVDKRTIRIKTTLEILKDPEVYRDIIFNKEG